MGRFVLAAAMLLGTVACAPVDGDGGGAGGGGGGGGGSGGAAGAGGAGGAEDCVADPQPTPGDYDLGCATDEDCAEADYPTCGCGSCGDLAIASHEIERFRAEHPPCCPANQENNTCGACAPFLVWCDEGFCRGFACSDTACSDSPR